MNVGEEVPPSENPSRMPKYSMWVWFLGLFLCCGLPGLIGFSLYTKFVGAKHTLQGPLCARNLRSLAAAQAMYAVDNMGSLPGEDWMDAVLPYLKEDVGAIGCPVARNKTRDEYGFAMNQAFVGKSFAVVAPQTEVPLIFDSTLLARNAVGPLSTLPDPGRHHAANDDPERVRWRNNVAFANGSARATHLRF